MIRASLFYIIADLLLEQKAKLVFKNLALMIVNKSMEYNIFQSKRILKMKINKI